MEGGENVEEIPASVILSDTQRVESTLSVPTVGDNSINPDGGGNGGAGIQPPRGKGENKSIIKSSNNSSSNGGRGDASATTTTTTPQLSFAPSTASTKTKKSGHVKKKSSTVIPFIPAAMDDNPTTGDGDDKSIKNADRIRLGICAMDKKARSKPFKNAYTPI